MRIACCGFVSSSSGSGSGARYLILQELLDRGYEVDFFTDKKITLANLQQTLQHPNFRVLGVTNKEIFMPFIRRCLPKQLRPTFDRNIAALVQNLFGKYKDRRLLSSKIESSHRNRKYDLLVFLGLYAPFAISSLKVISWVQGPPQTEEDYIRSLKNIFIKYCGWYLYYKVIIFYLLKKTDLRSALKYTDLYICGSQWSQDRMIDYGIHPKKVRVLPYPVDLDLMVPDISGEDTSREDRMKTFLWLGRIDSRKRFDLLIEAYLLLLKERQDVLLNIVGKFRFEGYKHLVDTFPYPNNIKYDPPIKREEVPSLIKSCDFLIQPSEGENFGSSVAEATSCGIPVIVGPTNGTKDYIDSHSFVFQEYTVQALKNTMLIALESLDSAPKGTKMGIRRTAESNFHVGKIVDDLEKILNDVLT